MRHYETTTAKVILHENESVSSLNMDRLRIKDFDFYFRNYYNDLIEQGTINSLPESLSWPVAEYKDTPISLQATEAETIILYVPQNKFKMLIES